MMKHIDLTYDSTLKLRKAKENWNEATTKGTSKSQGIIHWIG